MKSCFATSLAGTFAFARNIAKQEEVSFARRANAIGRQAERFAAGWCDQMSADDNHEFGLSPLVVGAAEQRSKHRHITDPRQLGGVVTEFVADQARNRKALSVAHFNGRDAFAAGEGCDAEAVQFDRVGGINGRDRGLHFQIDHIRINDAGDEIQLDPERL